jgi:hypothetical protein
MKAAGNGHINVLNYLHGAGYSIKDVKAKDIEDLSLWKLGQNFSYKNDSETVTWLCTHAIDLVIHDVVDSFAATGSTDLIQYAITRGALIGYHTMYVAARSIDFNMCKFIHDRSDLIADGVDIKAVLTTNFEVPTLSYDENNDERKKIIKWFMEQGAEWPDEIEWRDDNTAMYDWAREEGFVV